MTDAKPAGCWRRFLPVVLCMFLGTGLGVWHNAAVARGANDPVTNVLRTVLAPMVAATDAVADWTTDTFTMLFRGRRLAAENARLRRQVARLTDEVNHLREMQARAANLEQFLPFVQSKPPAKLAAPVIAIGPGPGIGTLVVGCGIRQGVRAGAVVVAPQGLVGHVLDVSPTTSAVLIACDPRSAVGAMVQRPESRAIGICHGLGNRLLRCSYLTREADIRPGDTMITSGLGGPGGIYPKGIVIGTVISVQDDLARSAKTAVVRMAVDPGRLEEVAVLR